MSRTVSMSQAYHPPCSSRTLPMKSYHMPDNIVPELSSNDLQLPLVYWNPDGHSR